MSCTGETKNKLSLFVSQNSEENGIFEYEYAHRSFKYEYEC